MKPLAPIALFVYNRIEHTRLTIDALQQNYLASESDLFIYSDGVKNEMDRKIIDTVRDFCKTIKGFKSVTVIERKKNYGLAHSIIDGVTSVVNKHGNVIVVEDDLVTSKFFLRYMNDALNVYEHEHEVVCIHGYVYPVKDTLPETFLIRGADCWGWATWKRGWEIFELDAQRLLNELNERHLEYLFDWDGNYRNIRMLKRQISGKVDSWAIRWHASAFLRNKLTLYPGISLVNNIGGDAFGTHTKSLDEFQTSLSKERVNVIKLPAKENEQARKSFVMFFKSVKPTVVHLLLKKITAALP